MDEGIRGLLSKFEQEIKRGDWGAVYDEVRLLPVNMQFAELLDRAGVNPVPKMTTIPGWSFAHLDRNVSPYNIKFLRSPTFHPQLKEIGEEAFIKLRELVEVRLPGTVSRIGMEAFSECANLEKVVAGQGDHITLHLRSFADCPKLKVVDFSNYSSGEIQAGSFANDTALLKVLLPATLKELGRGAFFHCTSLQNIYVPDGVPRLSAQLFKGCSRLKSVRIPESVVKIFANAFFGCDNLELVHYGGDSETFEKLVSNSSKDVQDILSRSQLRVVFER